MKKKCDNCGKERELTAWVGKGGILDYVHGMYQMWCKECQVEAQLEYAKKLSKRIPKLEKELNRLKEKK